MEAQQFQYPAPTKMSEKQRTPEHFPRRCLHNLHCLSKLVSPRVLAACLGTAWNRRTTKHRFQQAGICLLCNEMRSEDKIEHYSYCSATKELGRRFLRLNGEYDINLHTFTRTNPLINSEEKLASSALLIYAVYNVFNRLRHDRTRFSTTETYNTLTQQVREAVKGHAKSMEILKQLWSTNKATPLAPLSSQKIGIETKPTIPRSSHSQPQLPSQRQHEFWSGGLLSTTDNM